MASGMREELVNFRRVQFGARASQAIIRGRQYHVLGVAEMNTKDIITQRRNTFVIDVIEDAQPLRASQASRVKASETRRAAQHLWEKEAW